MPAFLLFVQAPRNLLFVPVVVLFLDYNESNISSLMLGQHSELCVELVRADLTSLNRNVL